jgi:hypothetical protein
MAAFSEQRGTRAALISPLHRRGDHAKMLYAQPSQTYTNPRVSSDKYPSISL